MKIDTKATVFPASITTEEYNTIYDCIDVIQNIVNVMECERAVALYNHDDREVTIELLYHTLDTLEILSHTASAYIREKE